MTIDTERMIAMLEANFDKYNKALAKLQGDSDSAFGKVERRGKQMESRLSDIGENIKGFTERANSVLGAIGVGIAVGGLSEFAESVHKAIEDVANIATVAAKIGITTDALQELRFAAEKADAPVGSLDQALVTFGTHISQIASGGGKGVADLTRVLQANGVAVREQNGNIKSTETLLDQYADLIKNAATQQDRLRLAQIAFGNSGADIVNMLSRGSDGLREYKEEAQNLGLVLSGDLIPAAQRLNDEWNIIVDGMKTKFEQLVIDVVKGAGTIGDAFNKAVTAYGHNDLASQSLDTLNDAAAKLADNIAKLQTRNAGLTGLLAGGALGKQIETEQARLDEINAEIAKRKAAAPPLDVTVTPSHKTIIPPAPTHVHQDAYQRETQAITDRTATLKAEAEAQAQVNPLVNDYGEALAEAKAKQDLINAAEKAGVALTPAVMAKIETEAKAYGEATAGLNELNASQQRAVQIADDFKSLGKDVLGGFIEDLKDGKSAADAMSDALGKIADKLLDMSLDRLFGLGAFKGAGLIGGAGLLGGAIIPGILHSGGVAGSSGYGHGRGFSPAIFANAPRYHLGTLSAGLRPDEVPAILQRGEVVFPRGTKMGGGSQSIVINAPINAPGADAAQLRRVQDSVKELARNVPKMVDQRNKTKQLRNTRA
jgi:hypothetical protein